MKKLHFMAHALVIAVWIMALVVLSIMVSGQSLIMRLSDESTAEIAGTSNVHDFEMAVGEMVGSTYLRLANDRVVSIKYLNVSFKVKSLESGKGKMNQLTYKALKANDNPYIDFELTKFTSLLTGEATATGFLTIAGVKRAVAIKGFVACLEGSRVTIRGEYSIVQTSYNIEPVVALFGAIQVEDVIIFKFNLIFNK